jgi:hypothetical protein
MPSSAARQVFGTAARPAAMPMDAYRQGDSFYIHLDLPGVDAGSIGLTVEQNVLTVRADRAPVKAYGAELIVAERPYGQWAPGAYLELTSAEPVQLGRYGNLLGWYTPRQENGLFVFEFGSRQCPLGEFAVTGETISATRFYYDFRDNSSSTVAVVGLVNDKRVASITLSRSRQPDAEAVLGAGTFVIPALTDLSEISSSTHLTARDAVGNVLEGLPYRQNN